jgi:hypothetical protein
MDQIDALLILCDRYCKSVQKAEATLSTKLFGAGSRISQLRGGATDIGVRRLNRAIQWFSDNWPENAAWPEGVERPAPAEAEEPGGALPSPFTHEAAE